VAVAEWISSSCLCIVKPSPSDWFVIFLLKATHRASLEFIPASMQCVVGLCQGRKGAGVVNEDATLCFATVTAKNPQNMSLL